MRHLVVPRSVWPAKCHRVTAWHKDEHIGKLLRSEDELSAAHQLSRQQERLPAVILEALVQEAARTESVYRATAAMDLLFDAHESYGEILSAFMSLAREDGRARHKRVACCIGYLRLGQNRREVIGKHYEEITADHAHFRALAVRALECVASLGAA
jgi:hypothetical protein